MYDGEQHPHPHTIAKVEPLEHGKSRVITEGETGLVLTDDGVIMAFYPCWKIPGPVTYSIPGHVRLDKGPDDKWRRVK